MATTKKKTGANKKTAELVATASLKSARMSPRKLRLVLNLIKGKQVEPALQILKFSTKKGARLAQKVLESAVANAREHAKADVDRLWVTGGAVNMSKTLHRYMPAAHGRATPIKKRSAHLTIELGMK